MFGEAREILFSPPKYPKFLGDLLEALIGAVFYDCGLDLERSWGVRGPLFLELLNCVGPLSMQIRASRRNIRGARRSTRFIS